MRPAWSGYISFGLVNIPVSLYPAETREELHFHLLDSRDKSRIRYQRINEQTGKEVPWDKIVRAYEYEKGNYIIIKEEDFKKVSTASKTIAIENFVEKKEIDFEYFERPYFLVPEKNGTKSYILLREALKIEGKVAIAKVVLHDREHLAAIMVENDALILDILRFKEELRSVKELGLPTGTIKEYKITTKEFTVAKQLINSMTEKWKPEQYHDEYKDALMTWIENKAKGQTPKEKVVKLRATGETANLVELMKKSIAALHKPAKRTRASNVIPLKRKIRRSK